MKGLIPMLVTLDLPGTIEFYTKKLGFKLNGTFENENGMTWASLENGKVCIMFSIPFESQKDQAILLSGTLYCYPENVNTLWDELKDKVEIAWPIADFHYGMREFAIKDNNGYTLSFGQEIE